jgi:hypothetical protein
LLLFVALARSSPAAFAGSFERRLFVLNVERTEVARSPSSAVVRVGRVRRAAVRARGFVNRRLYVRRRLYNAFYVSPAQMMRSTMHEWLAASGMFNSKTSTARGRGLAVESRLMDFTSTSGSTEARAVVRLAVTLSTRGSRPRAQTERTYEETATGGGQAYVDAWSVALARVYARMEADLAATLASRKAP